LTLFTAEMKILMNSTAVHINSRSTINMVRHLVNTLCRKFPSVLRDTGEK